MVWCAVCLVCAMQPSFVFVDVEKWRDEVDFGDEGGLKGDVRGRGGEGRGWGWGGGEEGREGEGRGGEGRL